MPFIPCYSFIPELLLSLVNQREILCRNKGYMEQGLCMDSLDSQKAIADFERRLLDEALALGLSAKGSHEASRVGVALSGGADSVALLAGLHRTGFNVIALHCNFGLRGEESDGDTRWCQDLALSLDVPLKTVRFDTLASRMAGESVEMACRRLRYRWFETVAGEMGLQAVAVGHHLEDSAETVLLNLFRGTGIRGMRGIMSKRGIYVRPMLGMSRNDIESYLAALGLGFRTDSTNLANDYRRNAVRNEIIPVIRKYFPSGVNGILKTAETACRESQGAEDYTDWLERTYVEGDAINVKSLCRDLRSPENALFHLLARRIGGSVPGEVVRDIIRSSGGSGLVFPVGGRIVFELSRGLLVPVEPSDDAEWPVSLESDIADPVNISIDILSPDEFKAAEKNERTAFFDSSVLDGAPDFMIRHWHSGDRLKPYGMSGSRKVSDIFSDMKMPVGQKRRQWILTRNGELLWIIGVRASRLFKVSQASGRIIRLTHR